MCYNQIWQNFGGNEYLCKLGKKYLNASLCKFITYSLQHSETFDVSHVYYHQPLLCYQRWNRSVFLAHPVLAAEERASNLQASTMAEVNKSI